MLLTGPRPLTLVLPPAHSLSQLRPCCVRVTVLLPADNRASSTARKLTEDVWYRINSLPQLSEWLPPLRAGACCSPSTGQQMNPTRQSRTVAVQHAWVAFMLLVLALQPCTSTTTGHTADEPSCQVTRAFYCYLNMHASDKYHYHEYCHDLIAVAGN